MGLHNVIVSAEDPEANRLAENFMKARNKFWRIAHIEMKNLKKGISKGSQDPKTRRWRSHHEPSPHASRRSYPLELYMYKEDNSTFDSPNINIHL